MASRNEGRPPWFAASGRRAKARPAASRAGPSGPHPAGSSGPVPPDFDIFEWYPKFQSCVRYFLDHAQHSGPVQAVASFVNIRLPCQRAQNPILAFKPPESPPVMSSASSQGAGPGSEAQQFASSSVSLNPYIRRLVATGFDLPSVLHGFFGDDWSVGVGQIHEVERRNYLFAAKSGSWLEVKEQYDMDDDQAAPFLRPLQNATEREIVNAESNWSEWLAMQDWMIGPRSPEVEDEDARVAVKNEDSDDE